jgi:type 2 lantibiotic biosynthesis protein LanM
MPNYPVFRLGRPKDDAALTHGIRWDERIATAAATATATATATAVDEAAQLAAWQSQVDPDSIGTFDKRLRWSGLNRADAVALLSARPDEYVTPNWWPALEALRAACRSSAEGPAADEDWIANIDSVLPSAPTDDAGQVPFAHLLWPITHWAWTTVEARIDPACLIRVNSKARDDLRRALLVRLSNLSARAVTEDFTVDRTAGLAMMLRLGVLDASLSESRVAYAAYCRRNLADGLDHLLGEFPVLGRIIAVMCDQWRTNVIELLERLESDRPQLRAHFGVDEQRALDHVTWGLSDPHRGGRSVAILTFGNDEASVEIVYKPKNIEIEQRYNHIVAEILGELGGSGEPSVRTLLGDGDYGYVSFVHHEPCAAERLPEFYRAAGRLLGILHLLGTTDCHYENLISRGPELHLIDAETLFEGSTVTIGSGEAITRRDPLETSVLRIGMLPTWVIRTGLKPFDISALGVRSLSPEATKLPGWRNTNTDAVIWASNDMKAPQPHSLPVEAGTPNPLGDHLEDLIAGFVEIYECAMRPEMSARIITRIREFEGVRRRIVMRNTRTYALLQERATSPEALRSALVRGFELDRLARSALLGEERPAIWEAFLAELHEMENLDIPYFDYPIGSLKIEGGGSTLPGILEQDGQTQAVERVQSLSVDDLEWQVRLIRGATAARFAPAMASPNTAYAKSETPAQATSSPLMGNATDAAALRETIEATSFPDRTGAPSWLTLLPVGDGGSDVLEFGLVDEGLYLGRVGIAGFLSAADATSHEHLDFAQSVLAPLVRVLTSPDEFERFRFLRDTGLGMAGTGGFLRAFAVLENTGLAHLIDFGTLTDSLITSITADAVGKDSTLDVIGGAAGTIGAVARRHLRAPTDASQQALRLLADHLHQAQNPTTGAWTTAFQNGRPLTGLAHGASGIGLALIEAGVALDDDDLVDAGARGLRYESEVFDDDEGNWPDFRDTVTSPSFMLGWCAGAPGIGLARIQALTSAPTHADAGQWREDIHTAVRATIAAPSSPVDHVCCGNLGRATFLREAGDWADEPTWVAAAAAIDRDVFDRAQQSGRFRLTRYDLEPGPGSEASNPGLMQGLSGIGLYLKGVQTGSRDLMSLIV